VNDHNHVHRVLKGTEGLNCCSE